MSLFCVCCQEDGPEHCLRPVPGGLLLGPFEDCCVCSDPECRDCAEEWDRLHGNAKGTRS